MLEWGLFWGGVGDAGWGGCDQRAAELELAALREAT